MMRRYFRLSSELIGAIAKRLPPAKNQLSVPCCFFNQFYIYVMGELQIWGNLKFPQGEFKLEFPLGGISIGVSPSGISNSPSGNSNLNLPWGNLKF